MKVERLARENFFDVFCQFYQTRPIEKISVSELCKKTGYNRSTFYKNFEDIYDLLNQLEDQLIQYLVDQTADNAGLMLADSTIQEVANIYLSQSQYFQLLLTKDINFIPKVKDALRPYMEKVFEAKVPNCDAYAIELAMSALLSTYTYWYKNQQISSIELGNFIVDAMFNGVIKPKE